MMSKTIGFFDSGIGGLPYLSFMMKKAPFYCYKYLADNRNFPYGIKSSDEIIHIVTDLVGDFIRKENPSVIVIACNTASVTALETLRKKYKIPFVGVVPAIKPAAVAAENGRIGLFATNKTVSDSYTENLINSFASSCKVISYADPDIVSFVENRFFFADADEIISSIKPAADFFIKNNSDCIILGCTHFLYLEKYFRQLVPENVEIIDSREGVINQALRVSGKTADSTEISCRNSFFVTSEDKNIANYRKFAEYFNLDFSGKL